MSGGTFHVNGDWVPFGEMLDVLNTDDFLWLCIQSCTEIHFSKTSKLWNLNRYAEIKVWTNPNHFDFVKPDFIYFQDKTQNLLWPKG